LLPALHAYSNYTLLAALQQLMRLSFDALRAMHDPKKSLIQ
jgi:hypothetical protein